MDDQDTQPYIERSRQDRQVELARVAEERNADMAMILNLSWRVKNSTAHVEYIGGLDTHKLRRDVVTLGKTVQEGAERLFIRPVVDAHGEIRRRREEERRRRESQALARGDRSKGDTRSWPEALRDAAPVDRQDRGRNALARRAGEGAEERRERLAEEQARRRGDFRGILAQIDTAPIAVLAHNLLVGRREAARALERERIPLPHVGAPFFGSAHVFYVIQFWDESERRRIRWILKVPASGTADTWGEGDAEALRTEALMLNWLRMETGTPGQGGVPVPEVIEADAWMNNDLRVPYIIMEYVSGRRCEDVWFDVDGKCESAEQLRQQRVTILENVARAVVQLGRWDFDHGGSPAFDREGHLDGTDPLKELDIQSMVDRWLGDENCERTPINIERGPYENTQSMYTDMLNTCPATSEISEGVDKLLRLLIRHIREPKYTRERDSWQDPMSDRCGATRTNGIQRRPFVLTHPDLSMRNIILAEDGTTIRAILGWDGVRVVPRSLGPSAFPRWLVRDFNPFVYGWRPAPDFWRKGHVPPTCNRFEDPPWVLRELREQYAEIMGKVMSEERPRISMDMYGTTRWHGQGVERDERMIAGDMEEVAMTRQSLLALSLDAAVRDPRCRVAVLRRVLEKCSRSFEELSFDHFVEILGAGGHIDGYKLKCLRRNLRDLVQKGFVKGAVVW
ncbi:hypothetical protein F5Y15DRAFT_424050 [Xylariaceae sp. FL0016]|nr:hypothetical protein F5Y15DRAFT_424050 [Xylariaceae sp. FL0016]